MHQLEQHGISEINGPLLTSAKIERTQHGKFKLARVKSSAMSFESWHTRTGQGIEICMSLKDISAQRPQGKP